MILAFDVTKFFDTLDHGLLKTRLKRLLQVKSLPNDWFNVYRSITDFHFVDSSELKKHPVFGARFKAKRHERIAAVEELKSQKIRFHPNPEVAQGRQRGIPQGTPISAAASNLYMIDFDLSAKRLCDKLGAFYRRYSDDILIICSPGDAATIESEILCLIASERLEIAPHKTEKTLYDVLGSVSSVSKAAQYLGFTFDVSGPAIRESSLSRQWRKLKRATKRARNSAKWRLINGDTSRAFTKRLYRRFSYLTVNDGQSARVLRNFSSYGRRSAEAFGADERVSGQIKRFEKAAQREISIIRDLTKPLP